MIFPPTVKSAVLAASVTLIAVLTSESFVVSAVAVVVTSFLAAASAFSSPLTCVVPFSTTLEELSILATTTAALTYWLPVSLSIVATPASASTSLKACALTLASPLLFNLPATVTLALLSVSTTETPAPGITLDKLLVFVLPPAGVTAPAALP